MHADLSKITTFLMDMDGVLTDGYALCMEDGTVLRGIQSKDGFAIQLAVRMGYRIGIISGGYSAGMQQRFEKLGVQDVFMRSGYKWDVYQQYKQKYDLTDEEILYIGDDLPDYEIMKAVGYAVAPLDASDDIRAIAHWTSTKAGGQGCVREVIEKIMKIQSKWYTKEALIW
jgi:3-deoxy-D-manno-octulosonate 8-phosphate phosphatase (KDO 8-P phosphatase)